MSPLRVAHWKLKLVLKISCPPPWPEAKKSHLLRKWFFLASGQGGGHDIFSTSFNFQCATPRGLIRWVTVGCNYPLFGHFGFSFKFSMCYPKGAHWLGHLWLQFPTLGCKVSFAHFPGQRRRNNYLRSNQWEDWTNCMPWTSWTPSYMQIWPFSPPSRPEAQKKSFAEQMTHTMRRLNATCK